MDAANHGDDINIENLGLGCALESFTESEEVIRLIDKVTDIYENEKEFERVEEKLLLILNKYCEQPHLLDSHLDVMLERIIKIIRDKNINMELKTKIFKVTRLIINVRGYKVIIRHLPHEVVDLEPVLAMLENLDVSYTKDWEAAYVLLLWMSIIVKIPFDMSRLDAGDVSSTVLRRILTVCQRYLGGSLKICSAAAYLISSYLTRVDVVKECLTEFLDWAYDPLLAKSDTTILKDKTVLSSLIALSAVLKHGKRDDLLPHANTMMQKVLESNYKTSQNSLLRKYGIKVIQRIALIFLKPKVASWRYERGSRSLAENLKADPSAVKQAKMTELPEEDIEVPDEIEEVIEELMQGLKDAETSIRWSAAKGLGRVTGRLPLDLANEVVLSVLEILNPREGDGAWHGGCLALAELGRRGLLLPNHLPQVLPLLQQALVYEDSRGYYSIGDNVRDAACYVAWSFARAYDPDVLKPNVGTIASGLLVVALFDREIKCRKAAAAAFQEHVGRQGTFPHGIDIVTTADYFSVAVRQNAYLNIAVYVAGFPEYTLPLIGHLVEKKVNHWDAAVRELTASALHLLAPLALDHAGKTVLPELLVKTKSSDLNCRHGSILATAEVIHALALNSRIIGADALDEVKSLISYYRERFYFNGMGGEILRQAFCHLIRKCAEAKLPLAGLPLLADWQLLLDECLLHEVPNIRQKAAAALTPFLNSFYADISKLDRDALIDRYLAEAATNNQTTRFGAAIALCNLPKFIVLPRLADVIAGLLGAIRITPATAKWAESRRDCIGALVSVVSTVGVAAVGAEKWRDWDGSVATNVGTKTVLLPESGCTLLHQVLAALIVGLHEYTMDARGDVGAWVREAAMSGLEKLVLSTVAWDPSLITSDLLGEIMGGVAQQAVERIDRTRGLAGKVFTSLLHYNAPDLNIPHRDGLLELFPRDEKEVSWNKEAVTFPLFVRILKFPVYSKFIMEGLVMSIGGLTESLVKNSSSSFFSYLKALDSSERARLCQVIVDLFAAHQYDSRVIIPLFGFLDRLLGSGAVRDVLEAADGHFASELLRLGKLEVSKAKDYRKLVANMDLFCQLVQVSGEISKNALRHMALFLCNRLKAVRKAASKKLYECLLLYGDDSWVPEDNLEEVMSLLSDTNWELEVEELRPIRNKLCELMQVPVPVLLKRNDE